MKNLMLTAVLAASFVSFGGVEGVVIVNRLDTPIMVQQHNPTTGVVKQLVIFEKISNKNKSPQAYCRAASQDRLTTALAAQRWQNHANQDYFDDTHPIVIFFGVTKQAASWAPWAPWQFQIIDRALGRPAAAPGSSLAEPPYATLINHSEFRSILNVPSDIVVTSGTDGYHRPSFQIISNNGSGVLKPLARTDMTYQRAIVGKILREDQLILKSGMWYQWDYVK